MNNLFSHNQLGFSKGRSTVFLSRVSLLMRDIDIAILSVRPSVRPSARDVPVSDENGLTYCYSPIILVLSASYNFTKFWRSHTLRGRYIQVRFKNFAIFTDKSLYLADDTR